MAQGHETDLHHEQPYRRLVEPDDLVTDQALSDVGGDRFDHAAIAKAVADLTLSSVAPVNIALFGPWGSGKSTFYNLMKIRVEQQDRHVAVAYYDAWKYGGQALKRNFIQEVATQLDLKHKSDLDRDLNLNQEQSRIRLGRWFRYNWMSLLGAVLLGVILAAAWTVVHAAIEARWVTPKEDFWDVLPLHVGEFGLVMAAVLTALILGPKALESAVVKTTRPATERDDQFANMFSKLVARIKKQYRATRLVFFIDELDRCQPDDVIATLVDLKTFLDEPDCVFVVAADRDVIEHALRKVPQAKPIREDDPYYSTPGAFIDKIFQHQVALPPLRPHALSSFAHRLVDGRERGLWRELRDVDPSGRLFDDVVYVLIPAHVTSPRRVKVLLNNFATNARIAESRHLDWCSRARELAFLTVLETEFPPVAAALVHFPELLAYRRGEKAEERASLSEDRLAQLSQFDAVSADSVAGRIVREADDDDVGAKESRARAVLARQLDDYLSKLAVVADLPDPRPDLLYLRVVGFDEGLTDPTLGEMIDMAAERQPLSLLSVFDGQPEAIRALAARLLIRSLASQRGTGQANVLESACRLVQGLGEPAVRGIAHLAPEVMTHVGRSVWRPNDVPGALFLAAAQPMAQANVSALVDRLDPEDGESSLLLEACLPALAWMDDAAAEPLNAAIARFLPATYAQIVRVVAEHVNEVALRTLESSPVESAIMKEYGGTPTAGAVDLFDTLIDASLTRGDPNDLLWTLLIQALNSKQAALVDRIRERRSDFMPLLSAEYRICVALYALELASDSTYWLDWVDFLPASSDEAASLLPDKPQQVSRWARDAAKVVLSHLPSSDENLPVVFGRIAILMEREERQEIHSVLVDVIAEIPWGLPSEDADVVWTALRAVAAEIIDGDDEATAVAEAIRTSLLTSIGSALPGMAPSAAKQLLVADWRARISELPHDQCKLVDEELVGLTGSVASATVDGLRLRIAARRRARMSALLPRLISARAGEPSADVMAHEWLELMPSVKGVFQVQKVIPLRADAMGRYAARLAPERRTTLWIDLENDAAGPQYLRSIGQHGIRGEAIAHMSRKILGSAQQQQRDTGVGRLLLASFSEQPTRAEKARGETVGHREASNLALALVDTKVNDNIVLAARVSIHSGGVAYGGKQKLREAFNVFAHGRQSRNFTKTQAIALRGMGLLDPKRKGRWAALFDRRP